jgi:sulfate transport system permease protein
MTATVTPDPEAIRPEFDGDAAEAPPGTWRVRGSGTTSLRLGVATMWLSVIVLLPLAAIAWEAAGGGWHAFWLAVTSNAALESFRVTLTIAAGVTVLNLIFGLLIAWVLVRDDFVGKRLIDAIIDLPFALPTIVASLVMLALYGNNSPVGIHLQHTAWGVAMALAFVTLPFVVRAVQPVLLEIDRETEEAAASLGASGVKVFTSVVLPSLTPALLSGAGLAFSRAIGEFGSVVLIGGAVPGKTEVSSQWIRTLIENDDRTGAAAISIVLLAISFVVLLILRIVGGRTANVRSWPHDVAAGPLSPPIRRARIHLRAARRSGGADPVADIPPRVRSVLRLGEHTRGDIGAEFDAAGGGHRGAPQCDFRHSDGTGAGAQPLSR